MPAKKLTTKQIEEYRNRPVKLIVFIAGREFYVTGFTEEECRTIMLLVTYTMEKFPGSLQHAVISYTRE